MTMTRQHFELIANTLKDARGIDFTFYAHKRIAERFARALRATNPGFKPERFLRACGVEG